MKTVHKYVVEYEGVNIASFDIPRGAKLLSLQVQMGKPVLYFEVETQKPTVKQDFLLVETGAVVPSGVVKSIGTVMLKDESYVLHIYWRVKAGTLTGSLGSWL